MKKLLLLLVLISSTAYAADSDVSRNSVVEGGTIITGGADGEVLYDNNGLLDSEDGLFFNDTTNTLRIGGTSGMHISGDQETQVLAFQGAGGTNNEKVTFDFESNANRVALSSDTGVVTIDLVAMNLSSTATGNFGWSIVDQTDNQACNTGCSSACVFGILNATGTAVTNLVNCEDATADVCACAGQN